MTVPFPAAVPDRTAHAPRLYAAHAAAVAYYRSQLARHQGPRDYLRQRGLGAVVDRDAPWRVGFAPRGWTALTDHLLGQGFDAPDLLAAGLAVRRPGGRVLDLFRDRIVFPIRDRDGHTIAFIGRMWRAEAGTDPDTPKYLNSPDTPIYTKGRELFGRYEQRERIAAGWPPVLVEGPADTLAVWLSFARAGRTGLVALAPCGTSLTDPQLRTAVALPGARRFGLAVAFDGDAAGHSAADRAYRLLTAYPDIVARAAVFAPNADPADLLCEPRGRGRLRAILERRAQPLLHLVLEHRLDRMLRRSPGLLHEIPGRLALAQCLAPLMAASPPDPAVAALRHLAGVLQRHTAGQVDGPGDVSETMRCLTLAVADHLENPPSRP